MTITHDELDLTVQSSPPPTTIVQDPSSLLMTSGTQDWRAVQTCLLEDRPVALVAGCWSTCGGPVSDFYPAEMLSGLLTLPIKKNCFPTYYLTF